MGLIKEKKAVIMFVSENSFKTNVIKAIANQKKKKAADFIIRSVVHDVFKVDMLKTAVFKHEILNTEETMLVKAQYEKNMVTMPFISAGDPMIIWLMGEPKQIVKITHPSILTGSNVYYRVIR